MKTIIITGSNGLIGSECVFYYHSLGYNIIGIDDDSRKKYFGSDANTEIIKEKLSLLKNYKLLSINIKNYDNLKTSLKNLKNVTLIIHAAAQPSHDWAATNPFEDFETNALGTLNILEIFKNYFPESTFIFTSTNKVYGDRPNTDINYEELETRYSPTDVSFRKNGISEKMSIDNCKHSLFGVSKLYADIIVQEYGKYFNLNTGIFRGGCLTGKNHSGVKSHGFLSYLVKCAINNEPYLINGYKGKQVRDNIHSYDVVTAFDEFFKNPKKGEVYNIGGNSYSNCSVLEAINIIYSLTGYKINYEIAEKPRIGDHIWYVSDMTKFKSHFPNWKQTYNLQNIIEEMLK